MTYSEPVKRRFSAPARRFGYIAIAAINAVLLYVANHLLEWEWPAFLTDDFVEVLPVLRLSLIAGIAVNLAYLFFDPDWFQSLSQVVLSAVGLAVLIQTLTVFPFDFNAYDFPWETMTKILLAIAITGTVIGLLSEGVKAAKRGIRALS